MRSSGRTGVSTSSFVSVSLALWAGVWCAAPVAAQPCTPSATVLCLQSGRFQVELTWQDVADNPYTLSGGPLSGAGDVVYTLGESTGGFAFADPGTVEVMLKVLDGTPINGRWWVFATGVTNVATVLTITDTTTQAQKVYVNPQGTVFQPIQDTNAFPDARRASAGDLEPPGVPVGDSSAGGAKGGSGGLGLLGGRFQVEAEWATAQGQAGPAQPVSFSDTAGFFWFFSAENLELVVKMVDGRADNGAIWFFVGGLSNVAVDLTVTDTYTGVVRTYSSPLGAPFTPTLDNLAFRILTIEKSTNGIDADSAPGPILNPGVPVEWTYSVSNLGHEPMLSLTVTDDQGEIVTCPQSTLDPGETMACTASSLAVVGAYRNIGRVSATSQDAPVMRAQDESHYLGQAAAVPTLASPGLAVLVVLTALGGVWLLRRSR